ncbi:hypothetical protein ACJW30_08G078000 [Castanea mollissima]
MEKKKKHSSISQLPPGFRFRPSDEELIVNYLQNKVTSRPLPATIVAEIDLYEHKKALFGEDEWYFFSQRNRKYLNGARPNRATASGYRKANGTDKPILTSCRSECIGIKKALVFYTGRPPKAVKTDWVMDENRLLDMSISSRLNGSMRLDEWVLCQVRTKGIISKNTSEDQDSCGLELPRYPPRSDIIRDCQDKDCQLLASILASQALPPIQTISSLSFDASNKANSFTSVYGNGPNNLNTPIPVSSLESYINQLERKSSEESKYYENFLSNEILKDRNENKDLQPSKTLAIYDMNYYSQGQSQDIFNPKPSGPIINSGDY